MSNTEVLDKTFHFILKQMVETGQAPHYTEIAVNPSPSKCVTVSSKMQIRKD